MSAGQTRSKAIPAPIGVSGVSSWGGTIHEETIPALRGRNQWATYRDMVDTDTVIEGMLFAIEMLLRQVEWSVEPADEGGDEADELAEFINGALHDMSMSWEDTLSDIVTCLQYGWAYTEILYKQRLGDSEDGKKRSRYTDNRIGWRKFALRAQDTLLHWNFDDEGGVQAMVQQAPPDYRLRVIPIEKALLFRAKAARGNPQGRSVLRSAYGPWYFKRHIQNIEGVGIERDLAGLPLMYAPVDYFMPEADAGLKAVLVSLQEVVRQVRRDEFEGLLLPQSFDANGNPLFKFELLSSGGARQFNTTEIIARYDQRITMGVLADFILLGHDKVGSHALSGDKVGLFRQAVKSWADMIANTISAHAIPRLLRLNGMNVALAPSITPGGLDRLDLTVMGQYLNQLVAAGMPLFPDENLERFLRAQGGLPEITEEVIRERRAEERRNAAIAEAIAQGKGPQAADGDDPAEDEDQDEDEGAE